MRRKTGEAGVLQALTEGRRILIGSHYNPDGDAIGSMLALGLALEQRGKEVVLFNRDPIPRNLSFLPGSNQIVARLSGALPCDVAVIVDCSRASRVGGDFEQAAAAAPVTICIDHHTGEESEAAAAVIEPHAPATGAIIARLLRRLGVELDTDLATLLYTTLVVDTGFFRYSNTDARVLKLAARFVEAGADPWRIAQALEENNPPARLYLLGESLRTLEVDEALGFASMTVTQAMLVRTHATLDLSDEFTTFPRALTGVEVAALFREGTDGKVKVSLRSKGTIDVAAIARAFGGGGHVHAAGFTMSGEIATVKMRVREAVGLVVTPS